MPRIPGRLRLAVFAALAMVASTVLSATTPPATAQYSPRLPATASVGTRVAVGSSHGCAITPTGGVQCWGMNQFGQLGDGTTTFRETPVTVQLAANARAVAVAVGDRHSCALLATGAVLCWGDDSVGQLGAGAGDDSGGLVDVVFPGTNRAVALSSGPVQTCAISHIGAPLCWGLSPSGAVVDAPQPELLPGGAKAVAISTHLHHSCAVTDTGSVSCWGVNTYGQFGTNATSSAFASPSGPVLLAGNQRAVGVSVGDHTTCAVSDTGGVQCWGRNYVGQVGDGTTTDRWVPTVVALPGQSRATAVVAGSLFGCALLDTATTACWGDNSRGQHGDTSLAGRVTALATSHQSVCAVLHDGRVTCWGDNVYAQLGGGTTGGWSATPTTPRTPGSTHMIAQVGAGSGHSCAVNTEGDVWCWGDNTLGQLGTGTGGNTTAPGAPVVLPGSQRATELAVGYQHTCVLMTDGSVSCWGSNLSGQVGGSDSVAYTPAAPVALPGAGRATAIAAGGEHTCALLVDGDIACWGNNDYGQLGGGAMLGGGAPNLVTLPVAGVKALSVVAGGHHTCAVLTNGVMTCWGYNARSQLGDGTTANRNSPVALTVSPVASVVAMAAGHEHTCALLASGNVTCWGSNAWSQLGVLPRGVGVTVTSPTDTVSLPGSLRGTAVSTGGFLSCTVLSDGTVNCWGFNPYGALGDGTWNSPATLPSPGAVHGGGKRIRSLAVGTFHACAVLDDGTATCWGLNDVGQVGDGTTIDRAAPTHITLPTPTAMTADPGDTTVQLTWTEPRSPYGPQTWQVEGSTDDTTWWPAAIGPVTAASATLSAVTVSGLTNGTDYRFRVVSTTPVRTATVTLTAMVSPTASKLSASVGPAPSSAWPFLTPDSIGGRDPADIAAAMSRRRFAAGSAPTVHVAVASQWVDAVVAGAAAVAVNGPVLLVEPDALSASTIAELRRLGSRRVVVVGGARAVGHDVVAALETLDDVIVTRLEGADRYATATAVSAATYAPGVQTVFLVLASSSIDGIGAARFASPVLLTDRHALPVATAQELRRLQPSRVVIIGGASVVADTVIDQVAAVTGTPVERWWGPDRFATAGVVANAERTAMSTAVIVQSHELSGLAVATLLGDPNSALYLARSDCLTARTRTALDRWQPTTVITVGDAVDLTRTC